MKQFFLLNLMLFVFSISAEIVEEQVLHKIQFASCLHQKMKQPIWKPILENPADLFIFMGDNIYADADKVETLKAGYQLLHRNSYFQDLKKKTRVLATWDDHDYGKNDGGEEYPLKKESEDLFLNFWVDRTSPAWKRKGVYQSYRFGKEGKRVQIILLDTRYFRSLISKSIWSSFGLTKHLQNESPSATILGEEQWTWLSDQLDKPAEVRFLVSSIQFIPTEQVYEKWDNFPLERKRLFDFIQKKSVNGLVVLSGDRHFAEISKLDINPFHPLYEFTSSSLNKPLTIPVKEPNRYRLGAIFQKENYGEIEIFWKAKPELHITIKDTDGNSVMSQKILGE